jgi:hypothetical protein
VGFVVNEAELGQVFFEYFGFPCQFLFHRMLHIHHHLSSGAGTIGRRTKWTQSHPTPRKRKVLLLLEGEASCVPHEETFLGIDAGKKRMRRRLSPLFYFHALRRLYEWNISNMFNFETLKYGTMEK